MDDKKYHTIYTAKDIEAYITGKLDAAAMHALEKAALDDPFLAEALEGYEVMKDQEWHDNLAALKIQFATATPGSKVITLQRINGRRWKMAAAILVIAIGASITFWLTKDNGTEPGHPKIAQQILPVTDTSKLKHEVALNKVDSKYEKKQLVKRPDSILVKPDKHIPGKIIIPAYPDSQSVALNENKQTELTKKSSLNRDAEKAKGNLDQITLNSIPSVLPNTIETGSKKNTNTQPIVSNNAIESLKEQKRLEQYNKSATLNHSFLAQVVGPDNAPLPFANINFKKENFGTYADVNGNVRLVSTDSLLNIEVRSVGYQTRNITLKSNTVQNKIVLAEEEIVSKERATSIGRDKDMTLKKPFSRRATLVKDSVVNVEPKDGWDNYSTYIANNIDLPEDLLKKELHGVLMISFDVKPNGTITNIKIDQSGCNNCSDAARRLIEQGPQWKVTKGKQASAKIRVQF